MEEPGTYFPTGGFIVGDSAYSLSHWLLVPYPESECLRNSNKREFNEMLSRSRVAIERAFGQLVGRWRFLSYQLYILDQMDINDIITACCVLHNICIDRGEAQFEEQNSARNNNNDDNNTPELIAERNTNVAGRRRRDALLVMIFGEDALQNDNH